ncbi:hypothetical protein PHYBLDRAFT_145565 [Phycomyces blakesleeanus NRRL 1555(-)]|uniref:Reverse transcriptase domain-containing protein n=1 Tax=Phycomyces blakesleeanus (strain ATCC 8743b / DSM 1359 / FGSC 10004 / NBRC 33097 / NRRL 1555) TaxID=763407 RepID=A0A167ML36_PHYB8|nr:hypothetical protein PHYBLDRAFT_145565 [Phycomyces blakesleeanus NRRL 1555(-)]OAD73159.1 hypothetical protein PHYBLDRAFT_145565 [Phycomyces blakesleeanus NRRL 1555(-)]|eukprot:XP_018291199.1 hypothetical protein PHYBLDRAFT_145565 [Phycomyces blakesleeanus NRRL 1555(-)]
MERARRLAVFGFGTARQREIEAREHTTKALRLPHSLKHLETPESGEKNTLLIKNSSNNIMKNPASKGSLEIPAEQIITTNLTPPEAEVVEGKPMDIEDGVLFYPTKGEDKATGHCREDTSPAISKSPLPDQPQTTAATTVINRQTSDSTSTPNTETITLLNSTRRDIVWRKAPTLQETLERHDNAYVTNISSGDRLHIAIYQNSVTMVSQTLEDGLQRTNRDFLSTFFTIQEATKCRPILNFTALNQFLQIQHFKMESIPALRDIIEKEDYICKIDIKDAYVVVPIHKDFQPYLTFENNNIVRHLRIGEVKGTDATLHTDPNNTSGEVRLFDKQSKECTRAEDDSGIPRLLIQYKDDDYFTAHYKDDGRDPGDKRNPPSYTTFAKIPGQELTVKPQKMGQAMSIVDTSARRISVVEDLPSTKEWSVYSQDTVPGTPTENLHGCLRRRIGSSLRHGANHRVLDFRRKRRIHQRERVEDDILRHPHTLEKAKTHHTQDLQRRHGSVEIPSVTNIIRTSLGGPQCESTSIEPAEETSIRINDSSGIFSPITAHMGIHTRNKCVCSSTPPSTSEILELPGGSVYECGGRLQPKLETEGFVYVPAMEINFESTLKDEARQGEGSHSGDTFMEEKTDGMNVDMINHLNKATRSSTNKIYGTAWRKYAEWRTIHKRNQEQYSPPQVLQFLLAFNNIYYSTLDGYRTAIAPVLNVLYPNHTPIADVPEVVQFFKAKIRSEVAIPKDSQLESGILIS